MPIEVIASTVGVLGAIVGAILNAFFARRKDGAEIEKLRAEADKARVEADKARAEMARSLTPSWSANMALETAEEFARSLAAVLSRYILLEYLLRVGYPARHRSKEMSLVEIEPFLSLNRKAVYAHISILADTAHLAGTEFEYRDLLRASIYNRDFIHSVREVLEAMVNHQTNGREAWRVDLGSVLARLENSLLRAFEKSLANPRLTLLSSWEEEKFIQKYDL